ncbi:hypothetical protein Gxy13693_080_014 [Komagataeibacter xylinus NBRC 13693]|uniref:DUF4062 domain-containing protein n=2 Tax=Komagataeibacter TaxID=1434011 RepID=A0A0D6QDD2_KOMXY|nr:MULTISPECIES: hypothetical protein [Komagataeibacter]PYD80898.1 hypothetical protein CFR80_13070 [Komagataeibacter oboediens]GAO00991.1 hypothetical protein Gxy13693_080_014 [Komagataeibacter xylinus NBRC 13693]
MDKPKIFVSAGSPSTEAQEKFIEAIEQKLRDAGFEPQTVGRTRFAAEAPLKEIIQTINESVGAMIIAEERVYIESGTERRGGKNERALKDVKLTTPWNQIEAGMAYCKGLPVFVVMEEGVRQEGLLEPYDWIVLPIPFPFTTDSFVNVSFNDMFDAWKKKIAEKQAQKQQTAAQATAKANPADMTIGQILSSLKPAQLWATLGSMLVLLAGAFTLGSRLFMGH